MCFEVDIRQNPILTKFKSSHASGIGEILKIRFDTHDIFNANTLKEFANFLLILLVYLAKTLFKTLLNRK